MTPELQSLLESASLPGTAESQVQDRLEILLRQASFVFEREAVLSKKDRIDFLLNDGTGIEVKLHGRTVEVEQQLARYAASPKIAELVLVTARMQMRNLPSQVGGKRLHLILLLRGIR